MAHANGRGAYPHDRAMGTFEVAGEQTFAWSYLGWSLASHPSLLAVLNRLNLGLNA